MNADDFANSYINIWRKFRGNGITATLDERFQRLSDRIFTACDVYDSNPAEDWEINAEELKKEVDLLAYIWWDICAQSN